MVAERLGDSDFIDSLFKEADAPGSVKGEEADNARATFDADFSSADETRHEVPEDLVKERKLGKIGKSLEKTYGMAGTMLFAVDPHCGGAILANAENMAFALEDLAKENQAVRKVLLKLTETSAWGLVFAAHMPVVVAVAGHHVMPAVQKAKAQKEAKQKAQEQARQKPTVRRQNPTTPTHPPFTTESDRRPQPAATESDQSPNGVPKYQVPDGTSL